MQACVLYVEPSSRLVGLSLRRHLLQPASGIEPSPAEGDRIGEVLKGCKLAAMHHKSGAVLELPDGSPAFVHVSPDTWSRWCGALREMLWGSGLRARSLLFGQRNHLKEPNEPTNENRVYAAPEHTCRILDFSPMEQIHFATLRKYVPPPPLHCLCCGGQMLMDACFFTGA